MDATRAGTSSSTKLIILAAIWTFICLIGSVLWLCLANERSRRNSRSSRRQPLLSSTSRESESIIAKDPRKVVTVAADNIVFYQDASGAFSLIEETIEPLKNLAKTLKLVLIAKVSSDEQAEAVLSLLDSVSLLSRDAIEQHRVLFCESFVGRSSIVRQLSPTLHFESSVETVVSLENRNVTFAFVNFVNPVADAKNSVLPIGVALSPEKSTIYHSACGNFKDCVALYEGLVHH
eukprot:Gregarina_sp_Pseudo_9__4758@NODE_496_length_2709_cov_30_744195_g468_i0_p2_GENE_NODE_496_length_2709_cov_30_744195_g468_i0NODE_496_length_2709_cov_30_744195_g468_i0_p2_ORF_typecomplete_len234_score10_16Peroxin22/PF12827_7/0_0073Herpes_gE/PF02480_16/0_025TssC/PF17541_2/0_04Hum_adeno_E3A/PF05393_11/0_11_NODE_496_length_2709_cov_30_744195_g468_i019752676